ncbi:helix-turn-helix transcriptional regulator [Ruminiclostridium cellobioparum]|uniref:helix-turn-helix transcriptional regulator n=1 Tax=Ruminiclostridium cellobioparum TaxID=29355 RepID=UPI0028AFE2FD|nr:helix-turn-helix transcriptional regulator [Ruminiclostridium cellobioparum]
MQQQEVADKINVTRQAYTNYEANKREPELKTLIKIADLYMVSLDMIVGRINFQPAV